MSLSDFLLGKSSLQSQRDRAQNFAREQYDPSVYDPIRNQASKQATEGVGDAGDIARARTVQSLFSPASTNVFSGNQARALAQQQQMTGQRQQALAGFEGQLAQTDIQMRQQGQQQAAQGESQARQMQARQDAAIEETELQYEAELDRRRQARTGAILGLGGIVSTIPFGAVEGVEEIVDEEGNVIQEGVEAKPARSLIQRGLGALFGGGGGRKKDDGESEDEFGATWGQDQPKIEPTPELPQVQSLFNFFQRPLPSPQQTAQSGGGNGGGGSVQDIFSASNLTDVQQMRDFLTTNEGQMKTFGIDRPEMQTQIQNLFGGGQQPSDEELSRAEAEQIFQSPEFQTEYYSSLSRGGPIDRGLTDILSSTLYGYNTEGQRTTQHSISDIFQSPFIMAGRGFNKFRSAIDERNERLKEEALQRIMQGQ